MKKDFKENYYSLKRERFHDEESYQGYLAFKRNSRRKMLIGFREEFRRRHRRQQERIQWRMMRDLMYAPLDPSGKRTMIIFPDGKTGNPTMLLTEEMLKEIWVYNRETGKWEPPGRNA